MKMTYREPISRVIDVGSYSRSGFYEYFKSFEVPINSRTIMIDITEFKKFIALNDLRFFISFLYVLNKSANMIEELRHRIVDDVLVEYDFIFPIFTHLYNNKVVFIDGIFTGDFSNDYSINLAKSDNFSPGGLDPDRFNNHGHMIVSNIPWYSFTSMTFPYSTQHNSVPVFGIGKFYKDGDRIMIPLAIQTNHALVDGYHIGQFLQKLEGCLNKPLDHLNI
jgi:chloramphenicol O-acetyltransferase type A